MRRVTAEWIDKQGTLHRIGSYRHASGEDQDYHLGVGSVVVVDPVNARKKNPRQGRVWAIWNWVRYSRQYIKVTYISVIKSRSSRHSLGGRPEEGRCFSRASHIEIKVAGATPVKRLKSVGFRSRSASSAAHQRSV